MIDKITKNYIGVDVSKNTLDIYFHPIAKSMKIKNSAKDINQFINELSKYDAKQIVCEATGGYENLFVTILKDNGYDCWVVDPRRVKAFITASGSKAKTDKIDAKKIAMFSLKNDKDYPAISKTKNQINMLDLVNRKNDLVQILASEKTRIQHPIHQPLLKNINKHIKYLEKDIISIEKAIDKIIKDDEALNKKAKILASVPGIGPTAVSTLLSFVPELGFLSNKKISALVGLCPYDYESGKYKGKKFIKGGRNVPRKVLYMNALSAIKYNAKLKEFYERLRNAGKVFKVAIVAVMHKLLTIINSLIKKEELFKIA